MGLREIDWASMSYTQVGDGVMILKSVHDETMSRIRIKGGHDNSELLNLGIALNAAMNDANLNLAHRDQMSGADRVPR